MNGIKEVDYEIKNRAREIEKDFYSQYEWCLNPILTLEEQFQHLEEEIDRFNTLPSEWQRDESRINIYLFACSIACTIDDYISLVPVNLQPLVNIYPKFGIPIHSMQFVFNLPYRIKSRNKLKQVIKFREDWNTCLNRACRILLKNKMLNAQDIRIFTDGIKRFGISNLPHDLFAGRMKINEGFRCQDFTHYDVITLADKYLKNNVSKKDKIVILGPRTAGAYFVPLIKNYFELLGYDNVSCFTIRPKNGVSYYEKAKLRSMLSPDAKIILTDDYSNTGHSFRLMQQTVKKFKVSSDQITLLAPLHPAKPVVDIAADKNTKVITLEEGELYKVRILNEGFIFELSNEYYFPNEWNQASRLNDIFDGDDKPDQSNNSNHQNNFRENKTVDIINSEFQSHLKDGFQVRLKKLFEIQSQNKNGEPVTTRIIGKSVGWGWLGYHAYIAGTNLSEFVPEIIGLRNGILFMKWIDGVKLEADKYPEQVLKTLTSYIIERTKKLNLKKDPKFYPPYTSWGWLEILSILRRPFGIRTGRLMNDSILKYLENIVTKNPALIDGKILPDEWIERNNEIIKIDFEHHNFGAPNFDVVDPAFDLAGACFEFNLSKEDEDIMINNYIKETGDSSIRDRFILFKLLYALVVNEKVHEGIIENRSRNDFEKDNERFIRSWSYLIYTMNSFCAGVFKQKSSGMNKDKLFFLDLDGVLDKEVFGFQHTTLNGIHALALLSENGFSVVPNTGRSTEHIRNYCESYGFESGIAEYGSVILTDNNQTEIPLIDIETVKQLNICRKALINLEGVFIDPNYKYSLRAYRYSSHNTKGLDKKEGEEIIIKFNLDKLRIIIREDDTYFVGKDNNKGRALIKLKEYLQIKDKPVYAIGDSEEDIPMLKAADFGFAPANCVKKIKQLAAKNKIRITGKRYQNGLLEAAKYICKRNDQIKFEQIIEPGKINSVHRLLLMLLKVADQSNLKKIIYLLLRKNLFEKRIKL